jgi:hypothetical protein
MTKAADDRSGYFRWWHLWLALLIATSASFLIFVHVDNERMAEYARLYPHDGQDGLGALINAFSAASLAWIGILLLVLLLARLYTAYRSEKLSDTYPEGPKQ